MPKKQSTWQASFSLPAYAESGSVAVVRSRLERGTGKIEERDRDGYTALMNAASKGHREIVSLLLKHRADVEAKNRSGQTSVYLAAMNNHQDVVRRLLEEGMADVSVVACDGSTAAEWASLKGGKRFAAMLRPGWRLTNAVSSGNLTLARRFLQAGDDPNTRVSGGATALMLATGVGHVEVVSALIEAHASVDLAKKDGSTALHIAVEGNRPKIVEVLLAAGADPNVRTASGKTPATHHAAKSMAHIFQVLGLTLHPTRIGLDGDVWSVQCTSMSGEELACVEALGNQSFLDFRALVSSEIGERRAFRFLLPSGVVLDAKDSRTLGIVFADELTSAGLGPSMCGGSLDSML